MLRARRTAPPPERSAQDSRSETRPARTSRVPRSDRDPIRRPVWKPQGKTADVQDLLAPVCGWFTEGFDTTGLKEAKALLDELS